MAAVLDLSAARAARGLTPPPPPPEGLRVGQWVRLRTTAAIGLVRAVALGPSGLPAFAVVEIDGRRRRLATSALEPVEPHLAAIYAGALANDPAPGAA